MVSVISDLSLTLDKRQIVSIVGPSGCGKTTLLNTLCGLLTPDSGNIHELTRLLRETKHSTYRCERSSPRFATGISNQALVALEWSDPRAFSKIASAHLPWVYRWIAAPEVAARF
jgi:ABC-type multidrug transport system ATPase subunit